MSTSSAPQPVKVLGEALYSYARDADGNTISELWRERPGARGMRNPITIIQKIIARLDELHARIVALEKRMTAAEQALNGHVQSQAWMSSWWQCPNCQQYVLYGQAHICAKGHA